MNAGHLFTVDRVAYYSEVDSFINIQKKRADIKYRSSTSAEVVNLAYTQSKDTTSSLNLSIRDRSTALPENRINTQLIDQVVETTSGFTIETDQFLTTDVFTDPVSTQFALPLFYVHILQHTLVAGETLADVKILDGSFKEISISESKIVNNYVYNNLANSYDAATGLYTLYYISYLVRKADSTIDRYVELLSNVTVFRQATGEDLDEFGNILPGVKAYLLQQDIGANFSVLLPSYTDYGIRRLADSRLKLIEPNDTPANEPWFVSIQNGQFLASVQTDVLGNRTPYKYYIAEFNNQNFNPYFPFKLQTSESSYRVNKRVIKLLRENIANNVDGLFIDLTAYKSDGSVKFALTSDPSKLGTISFGSITYSNVLLGSSKASGTQINDSSTPISGSSIDTLGGFITLPAGYELTDTDTIETSYYYIENKFQISFFDLNPLSNLDIIKQRLVLFVKPEELASTTTQTVFWLLVNEDGQVIDADENFTDTLGALGTVTDAIANETLWYDRPSVENALATRVPSWAPDNSLDFIKNFTVEGDPNSVAYLVLGEVFVREAARYTGTVINDVRIRGGGLTTEDEEASIDLQPEATWYWDLRFWDGYPYPGAASYFVDIPVDVLEDCGGKFTPAQVQEIVHRHTAAGVYPVVWKYNIYEPTITGMEFLPQSVKVTWSQGPDDAFFQVYGSDIETGPFAPLTGVFANNIDGNEAELIIEPNASQFLVVVGRKGFDGEVCFSGPINLKDPLGIESFAAAEAYARLGQSITVSGII